VGGVTGELLLDAESPCRRIRERDRRAVPRTGGSDRRHTVRSTIAEGVGVYWRYEKAIRRSESDAGSTVGATGAIYAIRRRLWRPLPAGTILDDVLTPMRIVMAGYRITFAERARAFDRVAADADTEARRKIRTLAGNYQLLAIEPRLLLPWANPVWFQFVSHKLGRLIVPYALLAALTASMALAESRVLFRVALGGQLALYLLAGYGAILELITRRSAAQPPRPAQVREAA
jgi:cellulose synthase/poly-beta-1,6-N-acetylglucosamine synthase-like glycosyltransferase